MSLEYTIDAIDKQILCELQQDARLSYSELGRRINLSQPATAERVKKLESIGIITGYQAQIDQTKIGCPIRAMIRLTVKTPHHVIQAGIQAIPAISECLVVTGDDCYIIFANLPDIPSLEALLIQIKQYGQTATSIVLSNLIEPRMVSF
ncbi:MAG TPA: Lrp/AsnC family transcriptional regulator [Gammaproteobacteria bacterium]|nr:Lrp/AsnC family transcriptional regulator [Gammaproteobacteria bacterium]